MSSTGFLDEQLHALVLRPGMQLYRRDQVAAPGTQSGLYGLAMADGGLGYIGKAANLNARLRQHMYASRRRKEGWYDGFCFVHVPLELLRHLEVAHIHALEPERNRLYETASWPGHAAMVAALRGIWQDTEAPT